MSRFNKYVKETSWYKNKQSSGGGGGSAGILEPEPYQPVDFNKYLEAPSTEEINQKQDTLFQFEKDYDELTTNIEKNYKLYKDFTKELDDLEAELEEAPDEMQWNLTQKYNQLRDQHNELVTVLQNDTERQKQIYQEYTKVRATYDKDIEIYNRWASAKNAEEPKDKPLIEGLPMSKPEDKPDPTWGQVIFHSLKAGLNTANANFWNVFRMLEMGRIKADEKIDEFFFPGTKDRNKKFEEKYGKDPSSSLPLDILTDLVTDAEEIATESAEQAESKNWLKQSLNIGLRPVPQIAMSAMAGAAIPMAGAEKVLTGGAKLTADFMKNWLRMTPFGVGAGAGKAREIEKKHIQLGEEAPYMKMLIGGVLTGLGEMATEMPVYLGVMRLLKHAGAGTLINKGAKTIIGKYGKAAFGALSNIFLQGIQEGEMYLIGKSIDESLGDPQDWSKEDILEGTWKDFYGGLMMGFVMLGIGGGIGGSAAIATKSKRAFDRFTKGEDDLRTLIRKVAEYQGIILEEPTVEALAYKAKETPDKKKVTPKTEPKAPVSEHFNTADTDMPYYNKLLKNPKYAEEKKGLKVSVKMISPEQYIEDVREMQGIGIEEKLPFIDDRLVDKYVEILKTDVKMPMLVLDKADESQEGRHRAIAAQKLGIEEVPVLVVEKVTPKLELVSDRIRSELIKKAEESDKKPTRDELIESEDLVIVRKEGEKYTYSEQWIENCWKALCAKPEYKGLSRTTAIEKFMKERFPDIAEANNLKIDNWDYTKGRLTVEMTPPKPPKPLKKTTKEGEPEGEQGEDARKMAMRIIEKMGAKPIDSKIVGSYPRKVKTGEYYKDIDITVLVSPEDYNKLKNQKVFAGKIDDVMLDISITDGKRIAVGEQINKRGDIQFIERKSPKGFDIEFKKEPRKSLEEKLKEARKEIGRLRGIIKTIKGNAEKRQEFKKELVKYIKKYMPFSIRNKMLSTVKNVSGFKSLEKAFRKVIQYTEEFSRKQYVKAIEKELKAKRIKPKRTKAGMLKGKFIPVVQDKLDFIRANRNSSRAEALRKIQENIVLFNQGKVINIAEENELLNMVGIKEMDLETLQSTLVNIKKLKETGKTAKGEIDAVNKKAHEEDIKKTITVITGKETKVDEETGKAIIDTSYKTLPKTKEMGRIRKFIDGIINWQFGWDNLLDKLSSLDKGSKPYESDLSKIGDRVHSARIGSISKLEDVLTLIQNKFVEAFDTTKKKDIMKITRKLREDIDLGTFKNSEGDTVHLVLNKEQILKKVMQLDDPTLESTFTEGMFYTEEIENALREAVSEQEMKWIGATQQIYEYMWERINPIFEEMYGIHFPHNPNYSGTIRRDVDIDIPEASLMAQDAFRFASILNPSLKTRSRTKQSLKYDEMTASLMNYVMQMEHFINWAKPLQDLRSVFGDKRVKSIIHELYGEDTLNKINGFLDDMTRDGVDKAKIIKRVDAIRFNFTRSILAKPHIALKQIPSCLAYMTEMPVDDFIYGVANFWKNPLKNYRYIIEHSPYAKERFGAGFERDIHGAMQTDYRHLLAHSHKFSDIFMGMVRAGDKFAVMQGMWAKFYSETKGQVGKAKNAEEAMRRAEITTQRTQPSFTIESLATGQRGGSMLKLFTMFQNQPNKYFRIIADNARNFKAGRGNRAKAASNIVLAWVVLPMLFQFIGDGGKWYTPHQLRAMILGIFNDLLVFGSMVRGMYGWLIKEAYDVQASPVFATLREAEYVLAKVAKYLDPEKDITPEDIQAAVEHFAKGLGQFIGLPTPYAIQVKKAITAKDYRQLLYSEYILELGAEKKKKKKPYVKSYDKGKYSKYLKKSYSDKDKYEKYLKY